MLFFCTECICNQHAEDCRFNTTTLTAECINCLDNTAGDHCEMCQSGFFQDEALLLNDRNICQGETYELYREIIVVTLEYAHGNINIFTLCRL